MEHRYSDRQAAHLNIVIYKQNQLVALGTVKNIGTEGIFIESPFSEITTNQPLEIEFFADSGTLKGCRFKAVVVHRSQHGFGAEIENIGEKIRQGLLRTPVIHAKTGGRLTASIQEHGGRNYANF